MIFLGVTNKINEMERPRQMNGHNVKNIAGHTKQQQHMLENKSYDQGLLCNACQKNQRTKTKQCATTFFQKYKNA